jgi:hypothetical protein
MLGRIANSVFLVVLLTGLSILGNCSKASADYLPANPSKSDDSLFTSKSDDEGSIPAEESSSCASTALEPIDNLAPGRQDNPLACRKALSTYFGILNCRGNSPSSGAGSSNNGSNGSSGSSGQPLVSAVIDFAPALPGMGQAFIAPNAILPNSMASRLFRPPRVS